MLSPKDIPQYYSFIVFWTKNTALVSIRDFLQKHYKSYQPQTFELYFC